MLMIILCHFLQYYGNELAWWFNVGVQIFFVISGFLYGNKEILNPIDFIIKQFKKILLPYYVFIVPLSIVYFIFSKESISISSCVKLFVCAGTIKGIEHLWFIGYILLCYVITPYLYWISKKAEQCSIVQMTKVYLGVVCITILVGVIFESYFVPSRICCYIIGYFIANYYKKYGLKCIKKITILFWLVNVPLNLIRVYFKYYNIIPKDSFMRSVFNFIEPYAHMILGIGLFLGQYLLFQRTKTFGVVKLSDKFSYYIYIVHHMFVLGPYNIMALTPVEAINWCIVIIAVCISALVLYVVSSKLKFRK